MTIFLLLQIDYEHNHDETDLIDAEVAKWRKESGWWGDQSQNSSDRLSSKDLKGVLYDKAGGNTTETWIQRAFTCM